MGMVHWVVMSVRGVVSVWRMGSVSCWRVAPMVGRMRRVAWMVVVGRHFLDSSELMMRGIVRLM